MQITISLTDSLDPLFLFTNDLSEADYQIIKNEQSLLVDFQNFTNFMQRLLEQCNNEKGHTNPFSCIFTYSHNDAIFIIQETSQFKQVSVIALKLRAANETTLKKHLSNMVKEYKGKSENFEKENLKLTETLNRANFDLRTTREEHMTLSNS
jgi:spindle assembly abnormal protein 6